MPSWLTAKSTVKVSSHAEAESIERDMDIPLIADSTERRLRAGLPVVIGERAAGFGLRTCCTADRVSAPPPP
jgi:hypothetical protein